MHEIFLTATTPDADIERAKALLQGLSGMTAYASIHRVLYFGGPPQPRGLPVRRSIPQPLQPNQLRLWSELHQNLSRQSFVLQVRYAIQPSEFGHPGCGQGNKSVVTLNNRPATLRWVDIPDPTSAANGGNPLVTQRKKLDISDTKNLPAILQDNSHTFKSELIEESFAFFTNNTEYVLVRYHRLPTTSIASNGRPGVVVIPLSSLPTWEEVLNPTSIPNVDPSGQWFLFVRRHVLEDTSPEKMAGAVKELETIRDQLSRIFVFRQVDRRAYDTRIERPYNNMPVPLPQKVRA